MTDYHHDHVVVYAALGGNLRLATTLRATVTDTVSGDPVSITQGAVTAAYVDVDTDGRATFTATTPNRLRLTYGATFVDVWPIEVSGPDDATVAGLVGTASATRTALDGRYVTDAEADATVAGLITAASTTRTATDARYVLGTATQPINRGGTGSSTAATALVALGGDPLSLTGTYATRPAATAVAAGTIYYATDIPEQYRSDGTTWTVVGSGGNELGYGESLVATAPNGTIADLAGVTTTFVVGERPIRLEFVGFGKVRDAGNILWCELQLDGVTQKTATSSSYPPYASMSVAARVSGLTPGSTHTAKVRAWLAIAGGTGIGDVAAGPYIQVVTV